MKKYYKIIPAIISVALVACYREEPMQEPGQSGPTAIKRCLRNGDDVKMIVESKQRYKITPQLAEKIAVNASSFFDTKTVTRNISTKTVASVEPIVSSASATRSSLETVAPDTLMYVVNFAGNDGYAVVSFDDRDEDVLMYSDSGNLNMDELMADPEEYDVMKFHVDMIMAYQQHKLDKIREAEASGVEYIGNPQTTERVIDEYDFPTNLAENPYGETATRAGVPGMPGSGLPGGNTGGPGMPGMPDYGCLQSKYSTHSWSGNQYVINEAIYRYLNTKCFGPAVAPPSFDPHVPGGVIGQPSEGGPIDSGGSGGYGDDDIYCPFPPYCDPPITSLDLYYDYYGAVLETSYRTDSLIVAEQVGPMLTTAWTQDEPFNRFIYANWIFGNTPDRKDVGCGPVAMAQIMVYHEHPTSFKSTFPYETNSPERLYLLNMSELKKLEEDIDVYNSPYADEAAMLVREIGYRTGTKYTRWGSGVISLIKLWDGTDVVRAASDRSDIRQTVKRSIIAAMKKRSVTN